MIYYLADESGYWMLMMKSINVLEPLQAAMVHDIHGRAGQATAGRTTRRRVRSEARTRGRGAGLERVEKRSWARTFEKSGAALELRQKVSTGLEWEEGGDSER
ncbi:hypothetical protein B0H10DRAFT_1970590 [Mycena sp. CBHHK59/15]|nr:hypothetical protein B0H10DRAFT_1970590 [Mycena sp. CBHHK59/15]